jgi:hypothetical protein
VVADEEERFLQFIHLIGVLKVISFGLEGTLFSIFLQEVQ